jgi:hypothetical protein
VSLLEAVLALIFFSFTIGVVLLIFRVVGFFPYEFEEEALSHLGFSCGLKFLPLKFFLLLSFTK